MGDAVEAEFMTAVESLEKLRILSERSPLFMVLYLLYKRRAGGGSRKAAAGKDS